MTATAQVADEAQALVLLPGIYRMPADAYHADPVPERSLSASGAKTLLECPAKYRYQLEHPKPPTKAMNRGTAAHTVVLGDGPELVPVDGNRNANAVKARIAEVINDGGLPLKPADYDEAMAMAATLRAHPMTRVPLDPDGGEAEASLFWFDKPTGIWRRTRLDWLHHGPQSNGRMFVWDYKTTSSARPWDIARTVTKRGYHISAGQHVDAVHALRYDGPIDYLLIFQETEPPYVVTVVQLDDEAIEAGRARMRRALEMLRDCRESGLWPGYSSDVELISLPPWAVSQALEES